MKIHFLSNSLNMNSGFGNVTRYIASGLRDLGYDISMTGIQNAYTSGWYDNIEMLPLDTKYVDETTQLMLNIKETNPDILFYVGQLDADLNHFVRIFPKTWVYCPVEGRDISDMMTNDMMGIINRGGKVIAQCRYGSSEMSKVRINAPYIYHGYNPKIFYPINDKNDKELTEPYCYYGTKVGKEESNPRLMCRQGCFHCNSNEDGNANGIKCPYFKEEKVKVLRLLNGKWTEIETYISKLSDHVKGKYVYGSVGINFGIRKRIERLIRTYSILINGNKQLRDRTLLWLHCKPISINGVNLLKEVMKSEISSNVIFSYGNTRSNAWTEEGICRLYNIFDCHVSASSSEGFGLPTLESMACGIPNIAPDCSSFTELIGDGEKDNGKESRGLLANIESWQMVQDGCLLEDSPILTLDRGLQKIKDIKVGDKVLTHKGRFMRVSLIMKREYNGDMIKIIPHKLRIPITLTPEHRVLGVKTKPCSGPGWAVCHYGRDCYYTDKRRPGRLYKHCKYIKGEEPFTKYKMEWIDAKDLKVGDYVAYPRFKEKVVDIDKIRILDYIDDFLNITGDSYDDNSIQTDIFGGFVEKKIKMYGKMVTNAKDMPAEIEISKEFLRLSGYFIAEGNVFEYGIGFTFNIDEIEYLEDVEKLVKDIFGLDCRHSIDEEGHKHTLIVGNKILANMFQNMFCPKEYIIKKGHGSKSNIVRIPPEFLNLSLEKLAELIKGEYRGDGSFESYEYNIITSSETLANQLLCILSRFGILVSIYKKINKDGIIYHVGIQGKDVEIFDKIIGERHEYGERTKSSQYLKGNNHYFVPIENIDIIQHNGYVWNLEIEEDNTYVSTITVHNSYRALVDENDLATKMKRLYNDDELREKLGNNGMEWARQYTWQNIVKQWDALLKQMT